MDLKNGNQKAQIVAALQQLAQGNERSKRARLSEIFADVEAALAAGTTQKKVIATLEKQGLVFTLRSFETTYARIRKERAAEPVAAACDVRPETAEQIPGRPDRRNQFPSRIPAMKESQTLPTPDLTEGEETDRKKRTVKKAAAIAMAENYTSRSDGSFFDDILGKGKTK